jgi:hypothetical protein
MMTVAEKIEMFKGKKAFIKDISNAFEGKSVNSSVSKIDYEVYHKEVTRDGNVYQHYVEFVIVRFYGGGKSVKVVSGNSNTANFRVLGSMLDGGYYEDNMGYDKLSEMGFTKVNLDGSKLDELLLKPMTHISDVRECFNYCKNSEDVERVIEMIPTVFGSFEVDFKDSEEEGTFVIFNEWYTDDGPESEYTEYEFYTEE